MRATQITAFLSLLALAAALPAPSIILEGYKSDDPLSVFGDRGHGGGPKKRSADASADNVAWPQGPYVHGDPGPGSEQGGKRSEIPPPVDDAAGKDHGHGGP